MERTLKIGIRKYHGFLIDADNTIFDYQRCEKEAFIETLLATDFNGQLESAYLKFHFINQALWKDFTDGTLPIASLNSQRFKILFKTLKLKANIKATARLYLDNLSKKIYTFPRAIQTLEFLSRRANLCLITNGLSYVQRNRIARAELEVFFKNIIIAEEIGCHKPQREFFKQAATALQLPLHNILCVGDTLETDIKGAREYGLDTCLFIARQLPYAYTDFFPEYTISDFADLKKFAPEIS